MIGSKYGMLTIVELAGKSKDRQKVYLCKCDCGKKIKAISGNLKKGNTKSCGCIRKEKTSVRMSKLNFKHGETINVTAEPELAFIMTGKYMRILRNILDNRHHKHIL